MAPSATPSTATPAPSIAKRTASTPSERTDRQRVEDLEVKPYVIVGDLGKGSFATVYRGYHEVRMRYLRALLEVLSLAHLANTSPSCNQDSKQKRSQPKAV